MLLLFDMERFINRLSEWLDLNKPNALQWHEWTEWHAKNKAERPVAYWLTETLPDFGRDIRKRITKPFNDVRYWIRCRVFDKYHIIRTGLKPGYADCDVRMLHGMFNLLVDFVEVEKAWMNVAFDAEARKKYHVPWYSIGWLRFRSFRNPQAGLDHLRWEMTLDDPNLPYGERSPHQAEVAREIWEIYHWWKYVRPTRPDPMDASGWSAYCDARRDQGIHFLDDSKETPESRKESRRILDNCRDIEVAQEREDEEMLIRLIKIRKSLWT